MRLFLDLGLARSRRSRIIAGTGIDLSAWNSPLRSYKRAITIGFVSRLYAEKGVREFAAAAEVLHSRKARFVIVGAPDHGVSTTIGEDELRKWQSAGILEWWGHRDDMTEVYPQLDVLVFPSSHPEGIPRTLLEAAACGVPALASDQDGCREVVIDGYSGWILLRPRTADIVSGLRPLIDDPSLLVGASQNARAVVEAKFSLRTVLAELDELLDIPM